MACRRHREAGRWVFVALIPILIVAVVTSQPIRPRRSAGPTGRRGQLLVDDFSRRARNRVFGTQWTVVTDSVMGGASTGRMQFIEHGGRPCLHMTGEVSLDNNGGFIQARLNLHRRRGHFNARVFEGIRLKVKGNGRRYALHLRTNDTQRPWQFYEAEFATDGTWQQIDIPFEQFAPSALDKPLDVTTLRRIAIVAAPTREAPPVNRETSRAKANARYASRETLHETADIFIDQIAFYRDRPMYKKLTPQEEWVIAEKGTENPFTGRFNEHFEKGVYTCKRCGASLFESSSKFKSQCGWLSFDDQIPGAVKKVPDADGVRTEILCAACGGHLGHVFTGENLTPKNTRYCVNSISMDFAAAEHPKTERAIFASGCFWGTEYHLQRAPGVLSTTVGYAGGHVDNPTYKQVCTDKTGHAEAVEVIYDPSRTSYEQLAKLFFETHDFTQLNRQGPDVGKQYRSAIFYLDDRQRKVAADLVGVLRQKGYDVKTEITAAGTFWPAEDYHQDYFESTARQPYCHVYRKVF